MSAYGPGGAPLNKYEELEFKGKNYPLNKSFPYLNIYLRKIKGNFFCFVLIKNYTTGILWH
jgi:hypothetical protein